MIQGSSDREAELEALWHEAREYARRTFSNLAVTSPTGVRLLEVAPVPSDPAKSKITVRDYNGHALLTNDTVSGWGLASPQNGYPAYAALPSVSTTATTFTEMWLYSGFTYGKHIEWAYVAGSEFTDTFAEARLEWANLVSGPWNVVAGSTFQSNNDVSNPATVYTVFSGSFDLPLVAPGNDFSVRIMLRKAAGTGAKVYVTPVYLNQV